MNRYVLDTDTCIYWLKGNRHIEKKIVSVGLEHIYLAIITECELYYGACKSAKTERNLEVLKGLRERIRTIQTSVDVAPLYGKIKADLEKKGETLDDADLLIASIVLAVDGVIVTNNTRHFMRIPGLRVENWIR